ncbi:MAG: argininosuccinate synthase [Firmicutes bacterium HGW-Firmicutes-3]|nr:MAG: argininosuccinate synthase [Firmicutes bacterium HGW-Firmicutes-3]
MNNKVVLAYSGGCEVIAVCVDVGQGKEIDGLEERALSTGASKLYIENITDSFVDDYVIPCVKANAVYEGKYLLGTSMARPGIAKALVDVALKEGATAICHGATGKGNDQVRFELTIKALAPHLDIIAPWRIWDIKSREDAIAYLEVRNIPVPMKKNESYSRDRNLWHLSHEGLELEDPGVEPVYDNLLQMSVTPEKAPDVATYIDLEFEKGHPTKLNGVSMKASDIIAALNEIGGANGIGIIDICENRVVGMKSRGVYETPGGAILYYAHNELEYLCLDKQTLAYKSQIAIKFAELVYSGEWFTPLREALSAFIDDTQKTVTGTVKLKLYKGNIIPAGATSPYSLYDEDIASFTTGDLYDHKDAEGFINLFGLPLKVRAMMKERSGLK